MLTDSKPQPPGTPAAGVNINTATAVAKTNLTSKEIDVADAPIVAHFSNLVTIEQGLINNRITWMMTFQGFLFAAFAVSMSDQNDKIVRGILYNVLPLVGMSVAFFTAVGVVAAISSISSIKTQFRESVYNKWPAPYSNPLISFLGRIVALSFPVIIIITWLFIYYNYSSARESRKAQTEQVQKTNVVQ
jgi:hypothetical protein